jgi:hypothetical protein
MTTYELFHLVGMWAFMVLGCFCVIVLICLGFAWCYDRWMSRHAREEDDDRPETFPPTHEHFTRHRHNF